MPGRRVSSTYKVLVRKFRMLSESGRRTSGKYVGIVDSPPVQFNGEIITSEAGVDDRRGRTLHAPVIDLDCRAWVVPSPTPGNFHLYIDKLVEHDKYMDLLDAFANCGIIEPGYAGVSKERGYSAVRLPWIDKTEQREAF